MLTPVVPDAVTGTCERGARRVCDGAAGCAVRTLPGDARAGHRTDRVRRQRRPTVASERVAVDVGVVGDALQRYLKTPGVLARIVDNVKISDRPVDGCGLRLQAKAQASGGDSRNARKRALGRTSLSQRRCSGG